MKTNVSIKFSTIEEYREIEKKLEELGFINDKEWNESELLLYQIGYVTYYSDSNRFSVFDFSIPEIEEIYNSLEEFLNSK